ncbi:hypothetical protein CSAL01_08887 [Colletotrichum salicis]|uniref:Uncharacterized protein n=1 Tax=Colletotrichum salicis TaxID=1209931 RepID=A0A135TKM1_9PEZI|nr:hypothetical protein CSAL01_08887 [Colletotrichum salicis]
MVFASVVAEPPVLTLPTLGAAGRPGQLRRDQRQANKLDKIRKHSFVPYLVSDKHVDIWTLAQLDSFASPDAHRYVACGHGMASHAFDLASPRRSSERWPLPADIHNGTAPRNDMSQAVGGWPVLAVFYSASNSEALRPSVTTITSSKEKFSF